MMVAIMWQYFLVIQFFIECNVLTLGQHETCKENSGGKNCNLQYAVLNVIPHDKDAFTQGLTYFDGKLYESIGMYGNSQVCKVRELNPENGNVVQKTSMSNSYFGEGMTYFEDKDGNHRLMQITWKARKGFIYDLNLNLIKSFTYQTTNGDGWGITYNPVEQEFVVSDGSPWLVFWDRDTLQEKRRIRVILEENSNRGVSYLNELEFWNGYILANVWYKDFILLINPKNGMTEQIIDFSSLYTDRDPNADCLNGISVTNRRDEFFITGKYWPFLYRIKFYGFFEEETKRS